jgi:hypothetical protein
MTATSYRVAAIAAILSAATTVLLWLLPRLYASPQGFDEIVQLHQDPTYLARLWVNYVHIFFALLAYAATAVLLWRRSPGLAGFGLMFGDDVNADVNLTHFPFWSPK